MNTKDTTRWERFVKPIMRLGLKARLVLERAVVRYSIYGDKTFFDNEDFPWTKNLEANWRLIRAELDEVLKEQELLPYFYEISRDQYHLAGDNLWKTYFLYVFGYKSEANSAQCPETARLMEQIPGMKSAMFSILAQGKHIPAHRGIYKGLLRCHLGLLVPEPKEKIRIRVGNDFRHWEEGKVMVFDDTFEHEVWHEGDSPRVVLFIDFVRPFRQPVEAINQAILKVVQWSPFVQRAVKSQRVWDRRTEQARAKARHAQPQK